MDFFPETRVLQIGPLYYGNFRLFEGADWHFVLDAQKKRKQFSNATEALSAARAECKSWMNPKIRATENAVKTVAEALGVTEWLKGKADENAAVQARAAMSTRSVRQSGGKTVVIMERRRGKTR